MRSITHLRTNGRAAQRCAIYLYLSVSIIYIYSSLPFMYLSLYIYIYVHACRDGGNTFTPERYRLELNSAHTFTGRQAPSDPHTVSGVFFLRKQN